jgi:hypothetical protein
MPAAPARCDPIPSTVRAALVDSINRGFNLFSLAETVDKSVEPPVPLAFGPVVACSIDLLAACPVLVVHLVDARTETLHASLPKSVTSAEG